MKLYIAEKPSVGKAIADNLGPAPRMERGADGRPTHYVVGDDIVTWVFGHILEQFHPEDYSEQYASPWSNSTSLLPLIPSQWKLKPVKESKAQLQAITKLVKQASSIVNAGDPDREGQLLVDEVLEYVDCKKPVRRILPNAIDAPSIKRILADERDNAGFLGVYNAGLARQRADWLVGMNMTRAMTAANQRSGMSGVLNVGRVQTPTLALVVKRDLEIENFKPEPYFDIGATFKHSKGIYKGRWKTPQGFKGVDSEGRLIDPVMAAQIKKACEGQPGRVTDFTVKPGSQEPPLPFSMSVLQKKAGALYQMGAQQVLDICQALYEKHKVTSYPRTDSQYLPDDQWVMAPDVLKAIGNFSPSLAALVKDADAGRKSKAYNSKKAPTHHAIVPTTVPNYGQLTDSERKVFELIAKFYLAQFYPDHTYKQTSVLTHCAGHDFRSSGRTPVDMGWRKVFGAVDLDDRPSKDEDQQVLPPMGNGDPVQCQSLAMDKKMTKPPARYTEGTLIHAMTNVHETVSDPAHKKTLESVKGIGTEATRSSMIEKLKKTGFLSADIEAGKIISTAAGRALIKALPRELTDVVLTALWENGLDQISKGDKGGMTLDRFMEGQQQWLKKLVKQASEMQISVPAGMVSEAASLAAVEGAGQACPGCGKGTMQLRKVGKGEKTGHYFFGCTAYPECKHTAELAGQDEPRKRSSSSSGSSGRGKRGGGKR